MLGENAWEALYSGRIPAKIAPLLAFFVITHFSHHFLESSVTLRFVQSSKLPTQWGVFDVHGFEDAESDKEHIAVTMGDISSDKPVLLRIHSECLTGDALFSIRCDCGAQLEEAMRRIADEGRGAILYLRQEGRGIGLLNKIKAYHLQDQGADTVEANEQLGFRADMRNYGICKSILKHLGISKVRLLTNNPRKIEALEALGISVTERISLQTGRNPHNVNYLETKAGKLGHLFDDQDKG
jgi:GTP cyclohydrolase II